MKGEMLPPSSVPLAPSRSHSSPNTALAEPLGIIRLCGGGFFSCSRHLFGGLLSNTYITIAQ